MEMVQSVLTSLLYPVLWVLLVLGWAWWPKKTTPENEAKTGLPFWSGPLAFAGGYLILHRLTLGWPDFPPVDATHWGVFLAPVGMVVGWLEGWPKLPLLLRSLLRTGLLAGSFELLLRPLIGEALPRETATWWVGGFTVMGWFWWYGLDALAIRLKGSTVPLGLAMVAGGTGISLALAHSAALGQLAGGLGLMMGMAVLVAWRNAEFSLARGALAVCWPILLFLGVSGHFYASLSAWVALLLAISPLGMAAVLLPALKSWKGWQRTLLSTFVTALLVGAAVYVADMTGSSPLDY